MGKHFNAKHEEAAWRALFARWHAGERRAALCREAGVSQDTWRRHAGELKMRIMDLPEDHPGRRRIPVFADRARDYRHHLSALSEGEWDALFRLRDEGTSERALEARFGVRPAVIRRQAKNRGLPPRPRTRKADPMGEAARAFGVAIDPSDIEGTRRAFDAAIVEAGARGDFVGVALRSEAKRKAERALFAGRDRAGAAGGSGDAPGLSRPAPPTPSLRDDPSPQREGEGPAPLTLRAAQIAPEGDWATWLFLGGRGAGKTLAGASWIADQAERTGRLALIGPALHDAREVMIGGPSGVMALPRWRRDGAWPVYEPSRRRLRFPNGAEAWVFSAEDPESLRGPQFGAAWADEFCAWPRGEETLALLRMGLRLGGGGGANARLAEPRCLSAGDPHRPRLCVTTTPKPTRALRGLMAEGSCAVTRAATRDNADHLAAGFVEGLETLYGGTRRAAQELEGRVVEIEGALFTSAMMAACRTDEAFHP